MNPLRGLFGSSRREMMPTDGGSFTAVADPKLDDPITRQVGISEMKRPPALVENPERSYLGGLVKYEPVEGQTSADRFALMSAALADAGAALQGGEGGSLSRVQGEYRKRHAGEIAERQKAKMQAMAQKLYGDDPEAQLLFMADPESFIKARAERFKPQTMSQGQTFRDPFSGETYSAPIYEKMDDRFGGLDPNTGQAFYTAPRGPTFQEQTGRMGVEETGRHNRQTEGIGWSNANRGWAAHRARQAAGGYGTPGVGMGFVPDDDVEIID